MLVQEQMTPHPVTLRPDTDFKSALQTMQSHAIHHLPVLDAAVAARMVEHAIGGLPVVNEAGAVVGMITESDVFRAFVRMHDAEAPGGTARAR